MYICIYVYTYLISAYHSTHHKMARTNLHILRPKAPVPEQEKKRLTADGEWLVASTHPGNTLKLSETVSE